jgi:hypothetical protein
MVGDVDFGNREPPPLPVTGSKIGMKWNDLNGNGRRDVGEPPLVDWHVHLFRNDDPSFHQEVTTDLNGTYAFIGLRPGTYTVCEALPTGWTQTAPTLQGPPPRPGEQTVDCAGRPGVSGIGYMFTITGRRDFRGERLR